MLMPGGLPSERNTALHCFEPRRYVFAAAMTGQPFAAGWPAYRGWMQAV
jgi:hypothetical protein